MRFIQRNKEGTICSDAANEQYVGQERIEEDNKEYLDYKEPSVEEKRLEAYGPVGDQLDMLYWDMINATTTWRDFITKIKGEIPKV